MPKFFFVEHRMGSVTSREKIALPQDYADFFRRVKNHIGSAERSDPVELPAYGVRILLEIAQSATRPGRGRHKLSGYEQMHEKIVLDWAKHRKEQLMASGMPAKAADWQAAKEASDRLGRSGRNIAAPTIQQRMRRRIPPRRGNT